MNDAQALVDGLADKLAEVEAEMLGHTRRCGGTGRHFG